MSVDVEEERERLFDDFRKTRSDTTRDQLVESFIPLADYFARRYADRSVEIDDLRQVARMGLVKAVDRYESSHGVKFSTFAGRTIDGELKRWFRDKTWAVRVPRSIQENSINVGKAQSQLEQDLGRPPTPKQIAEATGLDLDLVLEALDARANYRAVRIDRPVGLESGQTLADTLQSAESPFEASEIQLLVGRLLEDLSEREQEIVRLRFFDELSQQEIAERVGLSQMHVSRLLRRALESLHSTLRSDDGPATPD